MNKQKDLMPDGRRYIVYFTFDEKPEDAPGTACSEQATENAPHPSPLLAGEGAGKAARGERQ